MFVGGRGSGNKNDPVDSTYRDGYYWVTGPEGLANGGTGTKFAENSGKALENYYANWNSSKSSLTGNTEMEPNNSGPYVSVGFGTASKWDDVSQAAGTTKGFVQEENLAHSGLVINSNGGNVDLRGNVGHSVALKNLTIENAGNVNIGGGTSASGSTFSGIVNVDKNVDITGKNVSVGDRVTADTGHVNMTANGDLTVRGITAQDKIHLTSTSDDGAITLSTHGTNNGLLQTDSTASDAVIIDARGANGSFQNLTSAESAIKTGEGGNWKVYSASPDRDTFSTNLNSNTTARWHANSDGANGLDEYAATNDGNKYIFQVQPTVTVKADNQSKIYGDTADVTKYTTTATASFTGRDDIKYSVLDDRFKSAFQEGDLKTRYTGEIALSSEGAAKEKTRMDGDIDRTSSDNARPYFVIKAEGKNLAGKEGYKVTTENGTLEILRRDANISGTGTQTYGNPDISWTTDKDHSNLVNGDDVDADKVSIRAGSDYTDSQKDRKTANAGTYNNSAAFDGILNQNGEDASINYNLIGTGTIKVNQAMLKLNTSDIHKTYGDATGVKNALATDYAVTGAVNGDSNEDLRDSVTLTNTSGAIVIKDGKEYTNNVKSDGYAIVTTGMSTTNGNYKLELGDTGHVYLDKATLMLDTKDVETEYGTVKETTSEVKGLVNGDLPTGFIFDYGDYGGAYLNDKTKTNNVNTYHFGTDVKEMRNGKLVKPLNYTITGGEADVKIDPKDVTFFVSGTGNTLADVTYTVDPDIDAQLAYGEHVDADYTPGNDLGSNQYGVVAHINGTPIVTGDVAGNYRYNYGGLITLSPTVPTKPDIDPHNPSNLDGSGSWTSNMGNHGVPGVERVAGLASAELPFFKVEAGQVSHYGTYDVAADPDKVRLEPTGKRLPEPNQPKTQYREYTKTLTTTDGTGMFRMVYDGSVFRITPTDDAALALVRTGHAKNNVELSAEALHAGFSEMGILLEDLDGVYVHFENLH